MRDANQAPHTVEGIFENRADGVAAYVTLYADGYHVSMKDTDADEFLPTAQIFPLSMGAEGRVKAIALAKKWSNFDDKA